MCRDEHNSKLKELSHLSEIKARLEVEVEGLKDSSEQLAIARDQLTADVATVNAALKDCEAVRDLAQVGKSRVLIRSCRVGNNLQSWSKERWWGGNTQGLLYPCGIASVSKDLPSTPTCCVEILRGSMLIYPTYQSGKETLAPLQGVTPFAHINAGQAAGN